MEFIHEINWSVYVLFIPSQWIEEEFLGYLDASVECLPDYTRTEKGSMLLSPATRMGLRIICWCNNGCVQRAIISYL